MDDQKFVAASAIALIVTLAGIFWMRPLARRVGLVDRPNERKRHQGRVPLIGGLCFFIGTAVGVVYYAPPDRFTANLLGIGAFIVLIGLIDDLEDLSARSRLLVQAGATALMIATTGVYLDDIGPLFGLETLHLHAFGIPLTILAVVGLVNAFNMLDGIDGLAGTIALVSIIAILTYASADWPGTSATVPLQILGLTLVPYLLVNLGWPDGRRIFMGDAGSTLLGFVIAFSLVRLSQPGGEPLAAVDTLWCVALPAMDLMAVMYRRMRRKLSPFKADRRHLHHRLLDAGFTPRAALGLIGISATLLVGLGYLLRDVEETVSLAVFLGCLLLYVTRMPALVSWLAEFTHGPAAMGRQATSYRYRTRWTRDARQRPVGTRIRVDALVGQEGSGSRNLTEVEVAAPDGSDVMSQDTAGSPARTSALCVLGTAADYAHIVPIVRRLVTDQRFRTRICIVSPSPGQGAQLLRRSLAGIEIDLQILPQDSDSGEIVAALGTMKREFGAFRPDLVLTYGDSPGVLATALMAHYQHVPMARLVRSSRPEGYDELGAHIVRLLSTRRFPAMEGVERTDISAEGADGSSAAMAGVRIDADGFAAGRDCSQTVEALLELSQQPPAPADSGVLQALRAVTAAGPARLSAGAESS
jgi:undecaprenyl-phosphate alpha-N-acetylglucosaminyl 1-phosphatetransferase